MLILIKDITLIHYSPVNVYVQVMQLNSNALT